MNYNISKLADSNPNLAAELKNKCYRVVGLCQQVHKEMGPFLNEYMYQEALDILFEENDIARVKEYYFSITFHGKQIRHKHYVDFLVGDDILIECKAIEHIGPEQRQQLWNYMRLSGICTGVLYNFAPVRDQCERYYLDKNTGHYVRILGYHPCYDDCCFGRFFCFCFLMFVNDSYVISGMGLA